MIQKSEGKHLRPSEVTQKVTFFGVQCPLYFEVNITLQNKEEKTKINLVNIDNRVA